MMYQHWSPLRCIVMVTEFPNFLATILYCCALFKLTYGLSAIFLLKGFHIYAIFHGHRLTLKIFYWISIGLTFLSMVISVLALFAFTFAQKPKNIYGDVVVGPILMDAVSGLYLGLFLSMTAYSIFETFWQKLFLSELKHKLTCPDEFSLAHDKFQA